MVEKKQLHDHELPSSALELLSALPVTHDLPCRPIATPALPVTHELLCRQIATRALPDWLAGIRGCPMTVQIAGSAMSAVSANLRGGNDDGVEPKYSARMEAMIYIPEFRIMWVRPGIERPGMESFGITVLVL